jgi:hypothetical protein
MEILRDDKKKAARVGSEGSSAGECYRIRAARMRVCISISIIIMEKKSIMAVA